MKPIKNALIFGDSIARGVIFNSEKKRYQIAKESAVQLIQKETGIAITNRSHMGMTADGGLLQIENDLSRGYTADVAFLEFGGNDADFDWKAISENPRAEHLPKTTLDRFENDIRDMIKRLKSAGMRVVMATLPPMIADRYFEFFSQDGLNQENILSWLGDVNKIYRYHERYSLKLTKLARETGSHLIDLRSAFLEKWDHRPYFCEDGIHPNDQGQRLIGETVLASLPVF